MVLSTSSTETAQRILGLYLQDILEGENLVERDNLDSSTVANYLRSAQAWWQVVMGIAVPVFTTATGISKADRLLPFFGEIIGQRRLWRMPKGQKEPLTGPIIDAMAQMAWDCRQNFGECGEDAVLFDFARLGIFTGSRLGEYGQSKVPKGASSDYWNPLPESPHVPQEQRGLPCAFIPMDFTFYSAQEHLLDHGTACADPDLVEYVHVVFRYDKSKHNFVRRKFKRIRGHHLCPVKAALSIIGRERRWLRQRADKSIRPLGMFIGRNKRTYAIKGHHMQRFMQKACKRAYPNESHYMRQHIKRLVSHSLRVMAAVALANAGLTEDAIAFRLRWNSDTVKLYLRECYKQIGDVTMKAIQGAYVEVS